jgi:CBS domain-containing protein
VEIEKSALLDFLTQTPPLNELPQEEIKNWLANVEIEYFRQGETILQAGTQNSWVFLVRSGAVQVLIPQGEQVNAAAEGEWFGYRSLLQAGQVAFHVVALEDSLVYRFPSTLFLQAYQQYAIFQQFFSQDKSQRIRLALQQWQQSQTHLPLDQLIQ